MKKDIAIPTDFINHLQSIDGLEIDSLIHSISDSESPVSIRFNSRKYSTVDFVEKGKVSWSQQGVYLNDRPSFTLDPLFHAGVYYVQEAGSMIVGSIVKHLNEKKPLGCVLDLCAAPGGKSTDMASVLSKDTLILANEPIRQRASILYENLTKWGNENVYISNNDPSDFKNIHSFFDLVLIDAPCSGSGMFRKDIRSIEEWSVDHVAHCCLRQKRIVYDIWNSVKPGGYIIYSTCSYSKEENEDIVNEIINQLGAELIPLNEFGIQQGIDGVGLRFYPHQVDSEGYYIAVLQKNMGESKKEYNSSRLNFTMISKKDRESLNHYIVMDKDYLYDINDEIYYIKHPNEISFLQRHLTFYKKGVRLGKLIKNDFIPDHELAMLNGHQVLHPQLEVDKEMALEYLRKNAININSEELNNPIGWILLTYHHQPIGYIKNLGNRSNNYYPTEWRIRNL